MQRLSIITPLPRRGDHGMPVRQSKGTRRNIGRMSLLDLNQVVSAGLLQMQRMQAACSVLLAPLLEPAALAELQTQRLRRLLRHARANSSLHAERLREIAPEDRFELADLAALPVLDRRSLMRDFVAGLCAPAPEAAAVRDWLRAPEQVGELLQGRWQVWESSGTHGEPGWFVQDAGALAVYDALESLRGAGSSAWSTLAGGGRMALLVATGGHFASIAAFERLRREQPWLGTQLRAFSILDPLDDLVEALNAWRPRVLATYPTAAALLAEEAQAGRLRIRPNEVWCGGETLRASVRSRIESSLGCRVRNSYGASEFFCLASECLHGGLHLNADWALMEPVDDRFQPVAVGAWPHTTLLTHLGNLVQPLIRYDLGDRLRFTGERCPCGSRLPLIEVRGREDDLLRLRGGSGTLKGVLPLALSTVIEDEAGLFDYQLLRLSPDRLRLQSSHSDLPALARAADALRHWLRERGLGGVEIELKPCCPLERGHSGKLKRILSRPAR